MKIRLWHWFARQNSIVWLRISLGLIFFWFGALKIVGANPVSFIVQATFPFLATHSGNTILGLFETLVGIGLLTNLFARFIHWFLIVHLAGTLLGFFIAPQIMFNPYFPFLTLAGEFVFKNAALTMAGLVILSCEKQIK